jgi:hypothetical protein
MTTVRNFEVILDKFKVDSPYKENTATATTTTNLSRIYNK